MTAPLLMKKRTIVCASLLRSSVITFSSMISTSLPVGWGGGGGGELNKVEDEWGRVEREGWGG